jgi:hypothetical protein
MWSFGRREADYVQLRPKFVEGSYTRQSDEKAK